MDEIMRIINEISYNQKKLKMIDIMEALKLDNMFNELIKYYQSMLYESDNMKYSFNDLSTEELMHLLSVYQSSGFNLMDKDMTRDIGKAFLNYSNPYMEEVRNEIKNRQKNESKGEMIK